MSANAWYTISLVGYFVALVGIIITIVLYFRLDILDVIGDLSGRTVAKEIKSMRENRNAKGDRSSSRARYSGKAASGSKSSKSSAAGKKRRETKGSAKTDDMKKPLDATRKRAKNGTAEMGRGTPAGGSANAQSDKRVLHSKTDRLSKDTERLYEDFDPRVEYAGADAREETEGRKAGGTATLKSGTAALPENGQESEAVVRKKGTDILPERGTAVLPERGTAVLRNGTAVLDESSPCGGTSLLVEEEQVEPVKFSITRSYLVVHCEEKIL